MNSPIILVVDDQPEGADLLAMVLESVYPDARIRVAYGAHEALESAVCGRPDVAILDIEMPMMDGVQLAYAIREAYPNNTPLLVALSGSLLRISEIQYQNPFDQMLSKPADLDAILRAIAPVLSRPQS